MKSAAALLVAAGLGLGGPAWAGTIDGTPGPDTLVGTNGADTIEALAGDDVVRALKGDDLVFGGLGNDRLFGGRGSDELRGEAGRDLLDTGIDAAKDYAVGGPGADRIYLRGTDNGYGGPGDDRIWGTYAVVGMKVVCGPGRDVLIFNQPSPDVVRIGCEVVKVKSAG